jgi:hypothetical protein
MRDDEVDRVFGDFLRHTALHRFGGLDVNYNVTHQCTPKHTLTHTHTHNVWSNGGLRLTIGRATFLLICLTLWVPVGSVRVDELHHPWSVQRNRETQIMSLMCLLLRISLELAEAYGRHMVQYGHRRVNDGLYKECASYLKLSSAVQELIWVSMKNKVTCNHCAYRFEQ